jgi:hypothetical protein
MTVERAERGIAASLRSRVPDALYAAAAKYMRPSPGELARAASYIVVRA